jgi:EF hand
MQIGGIGGFGPPSQAMRDKMFAKVDANGDNALSFEEFKNGAPKGSPLGAPSATQSEKMFKTFDANGDGSLTAQEMQNGMDGAAKKMQRAMAQHSQGDSTSLIDLLFGDDARQSTKQAGQTDAASEASADALRQRQVQWMLDAFVSQHAVNSSIGEMQAA